MALYSRTCVLDQLRQILRLKRASFQARRTLLSDAYKGTSAWKTRRILAVNMDELKIKLDADFFDLKKPVSSMDLHKFIDNISDEQDLESAEQYLYCHRHSPVAYHLRASTIHSFLRACIDLDRTNSALKVLQDKTNYGVFPDNFTFNILLEDYIQQEDIKGAATVAMEMMKLEVLTNEEPLSQHLSLYACHQYLKSGQYVEEEIHDLGLTFADATRGHISLLSSSYHILGLIMAGRLQQAAGFIEQSLDNADTNAVMVQEAMDRIQVVLDQQTEVNQSDQDALQESLARLRADNRTSDETLESLVASEVLPQIEKLQQSHSPSVNYLEILETWHQEHIEAVREQIRAKKDYEMNLKKMKLEKLLEATGGLRYWLEKDKRREEDAKSTEQDDQADITKHVM